jgi:hypothetical protein
MLSQKSGEIRGRSQKKSWDDVRGEKMLIKDLMFNFAECGNVVCKLYTIAMFSCNESNAKRISRIAFNSDFFNVISIITLSKCIIV